MQMLTPPPDAIRNPRVERWDKEQAKLKKKRREERRQRRTLKEEEKTKKLEK